MPKTGVDRCLYATMGCACLAPIVRHVGLHVIDGARGGGLRGHHHHIHAVGIVVACPQRLQLWHRCRVTSMRGSQLLDAIASTGLCSGLCTSLRPCHIVILMCEHMMNMHACCNMCRAGQQKGCCTMSVQGECRRERTDAERVRIVCRRGVRVQLPDQVLRQDLLDEGRRDPVNPAPPG